MVKNKEGELEKFKELIKHKVGTIYIDSYQDGVRYIIMRGTASLCAYVGIPLDHPLAGFNYNDIPLNDVHGGLTFGREGNGLRPKGWFWYGWDYAHSGDLCFYSIEHPILRVCSDDEPWTIDKVKEDIYWAVHSFSQLKILVEKVIAKQEE